jgi:hypothetical protein
MIIKIWDFFFTRKKWEIVSVIDVINNENSKLPCGRNIILKDQFGNIKTKKIRH